jgi:tetratricopeptide (TPR) repeat protein
MYRIPAFVLLLVLSATACWSQSAQDQIQTHLHAAQQHLQEKRPDLAIPEFQAIAKLDPGNVEALGNAGVLEFFAGQYANAAQDLRAALKVQPSLTRLQALLGMSEKRLGETEAARKNLDAAFTQVTEEKLRVQVGLELIEADYALRDLPKAAETVNVLRQLEPDNVDILYAAHRIYSDLRDEVLLQFAMIAPESARAHQVIAHELARQGNTDGAIKSYEQALKTNPQLADVHFELAEMLNTKSSQEAKAEAEKEYKAALTANPFDEKSDRRLGDLALKASNYKAAINYYQRALEIQPEDADAHLGLAKVLLATHESKQAEPHLEAAAKLDPFDPATHYRLGVFYRDLGRAEDAHRELAQFEKLKKMKTQLSELYQQMHLTPKDQDASEDVTN